MSHVYPVLHRHHIPLSLSVNSSTSFRVTSWHFSMISCAILSPSLIAKSSCHKLMTMMPISPLYPVSTTPARTSIPCLYANHERGAILP